MGTIPFGLRFLPEVQFDKPWKSPWLLDFERRSAEDALKPKVVAKPMTVLPRIVKVKAAPKKREPAVPRVRTYKKCIRGCGRDLGLMNRTGICRWCPKVDVKRPAWTRVVRRPCIAGCGKEINANNVTGLCKKCLSPYRMTLKLGPRPKCKYPKCLELLIRSSRVGLCGWHNPDRKRRNPYRDTNPRMIATIGDAVNAL